MQHRTLAGLLLLLAVSALLLSCAREPSTLPTTDEAVDVPVDEAPAAVSGAETPIAWINGTPVASETFEQAVSSLMNQYGASFAEMGIDIAGIRSGADGRVFDLAVEAGAFLQVAQQVLTQQEADRRGITIASDEIDEEAQRQYEAYLDAQGWSEADLILALSEQERTLESFKAGIRKYVADQLLASAVQRAVAGTLDISEEEVAAFFAAHRTDYGDAELADVIDDVRADLVNERSYDAAIEWYDQAFRSATFEFSSPLLEAAVRQTDDLDGAILVLEAAQSEGSSDDPYLPYVLGTLYENKIGSLETAGEQDMSDDVAAQIEAARAQALECYRAAQLARPDDPAIQSKIAKLTGTDDEDTL